MAILALTLAISSRALGYEQNKASKPVLRFRTNVGTGHNCGRASTPLYCYGIPVDIGTADGGDGSFWLDTYVTGYNAGTGFVLWMGVANLGQATVTSNIPITNSSGQVTKLVVDFRGLTNDGNNRPYSGMMTLTFSYYYSSGGGGKGGGGAGWRFICTGGAIRIVYG